AQIGPTTPAAGTNEAAPVSMPPLIVRVPTLVIWGEKDTALLPVNLDGLDQFVPSLTIKRIPDGTHWVVREKASDVNRLIRDCSPPPGQSTMPKPGPHAGPDTVTSRKPLKRTRRREWFQPRKDQCETAVRAPMQAAVDQLAIDMRSFAPEVVVDPKRALFRI